MADRLDRIASLPARPLTLDEANELGNSDHIVTVVTDDETLDEVGRDVVAVNCVVVTEDSVTAAVYDDDEEAWYRVYDQPHGSAVLEEAYEAVRADRDRSGLFSRQPATLSEARFSATRPTGTERSGYSEGDPFDCPVCEDTHTVRFSEDDVAADLDDVDSSYLYVECPDATHDELVVEYQASTPP